MSLVAGGILIAGSGPADANPVGYFESQSFSLATGTDGILCGGWINGSAQASEHTPGLVHLNGAAEYYGLSRQPFVVWCEATLRIAWRNLDSGATGLREVRAPGADRLTMYMRAFGGFPIPSIATGPGRIEFTLTTDQPHEPVTFTIAARDGDLGTYP